MRADWGERPIAALARYENGFPFKPGDFTDTGTPVVRIRQLNDPAADLDRYDGELDERYRLRDGDLVFSWSGSLRAAVWERGEAYLNQHLFRVDPAPGVERGWLAYVLNWSIQHFDAYMHGSAMTHITRPMMKAVRAPVPSLAEQRAIADYLDRETARIDTLIEEQQRLVEMLRERRQGVLAIASDVNAPRTAIGHVLSAIKDGTHGTFPRTSADEGRPLLGARNVMDGRIVIDGQESFISHEDAESIVANGFPARGDVLLVCVGATIGKAAVYDLPESHAFQRSVAFLRPGNAIDPSFLRYQIQSSMFQDELWLRAKTSAQPGIYMGDIVGIPVAVPPLDEQRRISAYLDEQTAKIDALIAESERFIELSRERRSALITAVVTGQIDVQNAVA